MTDPRLLDVYALPTAPNVCEQILREIIKLERFSMAHVTMETGNESLLHRHSKMNEVYFVTEGSGILYNGDEALEVERGAYLVVPPGTSHKLKNSYNSHLEHLVFAIPPFDPDDVELLDGIGYEGKETRRFQYDAEPVVALDNVLIRELIPDEERERLGISLAYGFVEKWKESKPHKHEESKELFYVVSGSGKVNVDNKSYDVKKGSLVYIPTGFYHSLASGREQLTALSIQSPPYKKEDFHLV